MIARPNEPRKEGASESSWRLLWETARHLMARGEHAKAADMLRLLAIAEPEQTEIWDALADCHDAENRTDIGDALRELGRVIHRQLSPARQP